jgi:putative transposase
MTSKSGFAKSLEDEVKKARFSEQQIIEILKLAEAGAEVADFCRKHGISQWMFYQRMRIAIGRHPEPTKLRSPLVEK